MGDSAIEAGKAFLKLLIDNKELQPGLDSSLSQLRDFGKSAMSIGKQLGELGSAIFAPFAIGLHEFSAIGDELEKMSQRTGISASKLSEFKFASEQSGSSLEEFETALKRMQKTIGDAEAGSGKAADKLRGIGLSVNELKDLEPDKQFELIAKTIAAIPDPTLRAAAAMSIMGRSATSILPMTQELEELQKQARDTGVAFSDNMAKDAEKLHDAMKLLRAQLVAVTVHLGSVLGPALTELIGPISHVLKFIIDFIDQNKGLVIVTGLLGAALLSVSTILISVGLAARAAVAGMVALRAAMAALSKSPWGIAITLGIAVLVAALGGMVDRWLGLNDVVDEATAHTKTHAQTQEELAAAVAKGTKKVEDRTEALRRLNTAEKEWLAIADREKAAEVIDKQARELKIAGLDAETRAVDASLNVQISEYNRLLDVQKRLYGERGSGGTAGYQARVAQAIKDNRAEIDKTKDEITALQEKRAGLVADRDNLSGDAAKRAREEAKKTDEEIAKRKKKLAEDLAKQAEEFEKNENEALLKIIDFGHELQKDVQKQFESASRPTRGGFGGAFAEQIAGRTSADSREEKKIKLSVDQLRMLELIHGILEQGGIFVYGPQ